MPDPNKHAALTNNGFKLQATCSTCCHWGPTNGNWGHCGIARYEHEKHTEDGKAAGTPDVGWCEKYAQDTRSIQLAAGDDYAARYMEEA